MSAWSEFVDRLFGRRPLATFHTNTIVDIPMDEPDRPLVSLEWWLIDADDEVVSHGRVPQRRSSQLEVGNAGSDEALSRLKFSQYNRAFAEMRWEASRLQIPKRRIKCTRTTSERHGNDA